MAFGLSLDLSEIEPAQWRPVEAAKLADQAQHRQLKKVLSKKTRNTLWKRMQHQMSTNGTVEHMTRGQFMNVIRERFNVQG
jgi:hypothetical protein